MTKQPPKTVLHLIETTGQGGAETVFIQLVESLAKAGWQNVIVLPKTGWLYDQLRFKGFSVEVIDWSKPFDLLFLKRLKTVLEKKKVDLIQAHLFGAGVYAAMAALFSHIPVVATLHGEVDITGSGRLLWLKRWFYHKGVSKCVCVSQGLQVLAQKKLALPNDKVQTIYNGVDLQSRAYRMTQEKSQGFLDNCLPSHVLQSNPKIIGMLGNIREPKNYPLMMQALAQTQTKNTICVIAGEGSGGRLRRLQGLIESLGLNDRVFLLGFINDVQAFMHSLDLFVLSSKSEGFSIATIEAQACGIPVISTKSGGPEEIIIDNQTGLLVENENELLLAKAVDKLLANQSLRESMRTHAYARVQACFSSSSMLESYQALYHKYL